MTTPRRDPEALLSAYLAVGMEVLPDRVVDAVLDEARRTRQRTVIGPWRTTPQRPVVFGVPWRIATMNSYAKLAIAAVVVVVVAIGGLALLRPGGSSGPGGALTATPSPTPSPSATPSPSTAASPSQISTTGWVQFTSDRYGYTISYPPTHTGMPGSTESAPTFVGQAQRDFTFETDRFDAEAGRVIGTPTIQKLDSNALDWIMFGPDGSEIGFWGFAETIPAGTLVDDIISQSVGTEDPLGFPLPACESEPIMIDGQPGRFDVCGDSLSIAVVIVGDRAYVFLQGRGSVTKDLMMAQLSTVKLPAP
jgi:hypothetical protein